MFGERVKELRLKLGLSQAALAEQIGMTQAHLSALENDKTNPAGIGAEVYLKLCDALSVDCQQLRPLLSTEGDVVTPADASAPAKKPAGGKKPKGKA